jgi:arylsulfatase A-like enzyme/Tfp pilus assembly protein PilF
MNKCRLFIVPPLVFFFLFCFDGIVRSSSASQNRKNKKMNVLLITIDTLRADRLSCYGSQTVQTPNIDSLAQRGVLYSRAFANTSTTLPSHTNILSGLSPLSHGVHDNLNFIVREDCLTLAEHLKANGYETAAFVGAYPLDSRFGLAQGFNTYDDNYPRSHDRVLTALERRAEDVIDRMLEGMKSLNPPWLVWIHCYDPHLPYDPPEPFRSRFENCPYDGEVAYVDFALGRLMKYLEERDLFDETTIVLTGDHGESLGEHGEISHGFFAYNTTIWIPLIISVPGIKGKIVAHQVSHLDIFPTICDAVGIKKPPFLQGASLLPLLNGKTLSDRTIYFESMYPFYSHGWAPLAGFIRGSEKFIESPIPELYDLREDFDERRNLAAQEKIDGYRKQLERIILEQSAVESSGSRAKPDREALKKLKSLGYVSSAGPTQKGNFCPEDDVKVLLPLHNRTYKAMTLHAEGRTGEAVEILRDVIEQRKNLGIAYIRLSLLYMDRGKTDAALEILKRGLFNAPYDYDIYLNYIKTLRRARMFEQIIEDFHEESYREIGIDPEIWNNVGFAYAQREEWDKAVEALERALFLDDKYAEAYFNLGETFFEKAVKNRDQRLLQKAVESFKKAIEVDVSYSYPYFGLGKISRLTGNLDSAISCWKKALEFLPDFDLAIYSIGLAYLDKGDKSKALDCFLELKKRFFHKYSDEMKQKIDALIERCKSNSIPSLSSLR